MSQNELAEFTTVSPVTCGFLASIHVIKNFSTRKAHTLYAMLMYVIRPSLEIYVREHTLKGVDVYVFIPLCRDFCT